MAYINSAEYELHSNQKGAKKRVQKMSLDPKIGPKKREYIHTFNSSRPEALQGEFPKARTYFFISPRDRWEMSSIYVAFDVNLALVHYRGKKRTPPLDLNFLFLRELDYYCHYF